MKTNVQLISKDRNIYGITIKQETKTGFLSITDLQNAYFKARIENGWADRRIERILSTNDSAERIYYILKEQGIIKTPICAFMEDIKNQSLVKVMKNYGVYKTSGKGENRTTMCNPYIWVLLAMELNPELYAKVVIWLSDNLIINRIEAGDKYNDLCKAASKFKDVDYRTIAKGINYIVFNIHETMLRNKASETELKEIEELQKSLAFAIDMGYINSFSSLLGEIRKIYSMKWNNN